MEDYSINLNDDIKYKYMNLACTRSYFNVSKKPFSLMFQAAFHFEIKLHRIQSAEICV